MKKINIREALLDIDRRTNAQYDLTTLYEACKLSEDDKKKVVQYIDTKEPPFMIGEFLASKCDAVCEAIVGDDEVSEAEMKKIVDDINDGGDHTLWALMDKADEEDKKLTEAAEEPREGYDSRAAIRQVWGMIANSEKLTDDDSRYWDLDRGVHEGDDAVVIHSVEEAPKTANYLFSLMDDGIDLDVMLDRMSDNDTWYIIDNTPEALEEDLIEVDVPELENKIRAAATDVIVNSLGYDEDFARDYMVVETSNGTDEDSRVRVEVRADLSYEEAQKITDALNPIVREYDKDAYFDAVTHNTIEAYIRLDQSDDVVDEEAFNYWKNIFDKVTTRGDLINYYKELVRKRDEGSITWGTMDKLFDEVIGPLNDRLDAENAPKVEESLDEAAVGTMERPMTELQGTLSSILSSDWNAWAKIRHVEDAVAFLDEIKDQCKNKGYIEKVKTKLLNNPRTNIQQFFTNIIMAGDGQGVVKTGKSARIARDRKELGEGLGGNSLYLFPELTAEDLEMAKAYGLTYLGKNHGPDGSENNCVVAGDMSSLQRYADKYLGYELHPDYLYDDADDFAGEIIKEDISTTDTYCVYSSNNGGCYKEFSGSKKDCEKWVELNKNKFTGFTTLAIQPETQPAKWFRWPPDPMVESNGCIKESDYDFNKYRNAEGKLCADKWYAGQYPDDKEGAKELSGILMDNALEDRSIIDGCSDTVKERVNKQLDRYVGRLVNESKSLKEDTSKTSFTELKDKVEELSELTGLTIYVSEPDEEGDSVELFCDEVFDIEGTGLIDVLDYDEHGYDLDIETVLDYLTNIGLYEPDEDDDFLYESKSINEDNDERFTLVRTKSVPDSDGFNTDYTMYYDHDNDKYVFVFGDRDIYTPEDGYFDWESETIEQAYQWFDSYNGFADEDDEEYSFELEEGIFNDIKNVAKAAGSAIKDSNTYKKNVTPIVKGIKNFVTQSDLYKDAKEIGKKVGKAIKDTDVTKDVVSKWNTDKYISELSNAKDSKKLDALKAEYEAAIKSGKLRNKKDIERIQSLYKKQASKLGVKESLMIEDFDDEQPYTREQIEQELKSITKNFTIPRGAGKVGFKEEAVYSVDILEKYYKSVELDKVGSWYEIEFQDLITDSTE